MDFFIEDDFEEHNEPEPDTQHSEDHSECCPLNWQTVGLAMSFADQIASKEKKPERMSITDKVEVCSLRRDLLSEEHRGSFEDYIKDITSGRRSLFDGIKKE